MWYVAGIFLLYSAYSDLRCGMISVKSCLLAAGAGIAVRMASAQGAVFVQGAASGASIFGECARGLFPGLCVMGLAAVSGEQIGKGDAWIMLALGVLVGVERTVSLFVTGLAVSLPFAAVWYVIGRRRGGSTDEPARGFSFPFVPNLLIAYVLLSIFS